MSDKMKWALILALAMIGVCFFGIANAQTPPARTVGIVVNHTKKLWEDGKPITDPISYNIYTGACNGGAKAKVSTLTTNTGQIPNVVPGTCFMATVVALGSESQPSPEFLFHGVPGSADGVTVTITITVSGP